MEGDHLWTSWGGDSNDSGGVILVVAKNRAGLVKALGAHGSFDYLAYECLDLGCAKPADPSDETLTWADLAEHFRKCSRDELVVISWDHTPDAPEHLVPSPPEPWKTFDSHCGVSAVILYGHGAGDWAWYLPTGTVITRGP